MARKKTLSEEVSDGIVALDSEGSIRVIESRQALSPLTGEFGREDLNQIRDKINEIIARIG